MSAPSPVAVWWLRRDFRLADNPALLAAIADGQAVVALFVLDPALLATAGPVRGAWLQASLRALDAQLRRGGGPGLSVHRGRPEAVVPAVAAAVGAARVHISADFGPYGRRRDARVAAALRDGGIELVATGSPYAVAPGTLKTQSDQPFSVFTPFHRAWQAHGVHGPAPTVDPADVEWAEAPGGEPPGGEGPGGKAMDAGDPAAAQAAEAAGEVRARKDWAAFLADGADGVDGYDAHHDRPDVDATSRLSIPLRWGQLHPRTLLADLAGRPSKGAAALARQLAWRDFFADVLLRRPDAVSKPIRAEFAAMPTEDPGAETRSGLEAAERLTAWQQGRTGFPLVDAGMRQLLAEGYMHNRVRMVVASFLTKDLHLGWWHGADWFMARLADGDIAQNQLNWQWVAGCGMDAAPYFRVFNPITQGSKFDPDGVYIRRWVPELRGVEGKYVHEPWTDPAGQPEGYPAPIVDHKAERLEALDRYAMIKGR